MVKATKRMLEIDQILQDFRENNPSKPRSII